MLILYRIIINIIFLLSPIILTFRLIKKKEDLKRFKEKFCLFTKKRGKGNLIWFHGASVGELLSIIPLLEKFEKNKNIKNILVTSNTLSSSTIIQRYKFKKVIHQFFPVDTNFLTNKFLGYWKPSSVYFIDSEIWPNMFFNLKRKNISINLINGRITKKTFSRWILFPNFSRNIFESFDLCLPSSKKSKEYLTKLGVKNTLYIGNLKFAQSESDKNRIDAKTKKFFRSKKIWCASSTHNNEEKICGLVHKRLKKSYNNFVTIIIPRHIERVKVIEDQLNDLNLVTHLHESNKKIQPHTDIYIVNSYGKTKSFYNFCKNVFLGGSLIKHGGQNPLEAIRYGCNVIHGPYISNFAEIYKFLKINKVSIKILSEKTMANALNTLFKKKTNSKTLHKKIKSKGQKILNDTYKEINLKLNDF